MYPIQEEVEAPHSLDSTKNVTAISSHFALEPERGMNQTLATKL